MAAQDLRSPAFLEDARAGFEHIFNLDYDAAWSRFQDLEKRYPNHPAPPLYLATVTWFRELFERQELELDRFVAPGYFTRKTDRKIPASQLEIFTANMARAEQVCQSILDSDPGNPDARYFLGAIQGIRASLEMTINRSYRKALRFGKAAYRLHHDLVKEYPGYADAYLSVGLYEYIVDNLPWYVKWLAVLVGYRGSEKRGFEYLNRAAQEASFVADDARVIQMVLFVREKRFEEALAQAEHLHNLYPKNYILHLNRAQILEQMGSLEAAVNTYQEFLEKVDGETPNYQKVEPFRLRFQVARQLLRLGRPALAEPQLEKVVTDPSLGLPEKALAHLELGRTLDARKQRTQALLHYRKALELPDISQSHAQARKYIERPFELRVTQPDS